MVKFIDNNTRFPFMEGYDLYPDKFVLLGYINDIGGNTESGVALAVGDDGDRDAMWDLFVEYLYAKKYGELLLFYYGEINSSGIYI